MRKLCNFIIAALAGVSLIFCFAGMSMWVRSHFRFETFTVERRRPNSLDRSVWMNLYSADGTMRLTIGNDKDSPERQPLVPFFISPPQLKKAVVEPAVGWRWTFDHTVLSAADPEPSGPFWHLGVKLEPYENIFCASWTLSLHYAVFVIATALLPALWLRKHIRRRRERGPGRCAGCGYDLRASPDRCPECGRSRPAV